MQVLKVLEDVLKLVPEAEGLEVTLGKDDRLSVVPTGEGLLSWKRNGEEVAETKLSDAVLFLCQALYYCLPRLAKEEYKVSPWFGHPCLAEIGKCLRLMPETTAAIVYKEMLLAQVGEIQVMAKLSKDDTVVMERRYEHEYEWRNTLTFSTQQAPAGLKDLLKPVLDVR